MRTCVDDLLDEARYQVVGFISPEDSPVNVRIQKLIYLTVTSQTWNCFVMMMRLELRSNYCGLIKGKSDMIYGFFFNILCYGVWVGGF